MTEQPRIAKVQHVQITIPKGAEDEAREFYCGLLKLTEVAKPDTLAGGAGSGLRSGVFKSTWARKTASSGVPQKPMWHMKSTAWTIGATVFKTGELSFSTAYRYRIIGASSFVTPSAIV
jgi:hypothetical protein